MDKTFHLHYMLADEISSGAFCVTKRGINIKTAQEFAVKIIELKELALITAHPEQDIQKEIEICKRLIHPHVVAVYESYKEEGRIYIVSEIMSGLDLCYEIVNKVNSGFVYSESVASHYMRQVLEGLTFIHENGIIHRDMKPHNFMLASKEEGAPIKIGDFGIAIEMPEQGFVKSGRIGTPHFMAPEVVKRESYGYPVDIWGCGVSLYILLGGSFPFQGFGEEIFEVIVNGSFKMDSRSWSCISSAGKDLVDQMLKYNPSERITATEALNHPWLKDRDLVADRKHLFESVTELKRFNARRKLKGAILATMASRKLAVALLGTKRNGITADSNNNDSPVLTGAEAVTQLVDTFDDIKDITGAQNHDVRFLQCLFQNQKLLALMKIYTLSQKAVKELDVQQAKSDAEEKLYEVGVLLSSLEHLDDKCKSLKNILDNHHITAMIRSHDDIIKTLQGQNDVFGGYKYTANTAADNLTRVRLVQFSKNNSEPMGITLRKDEKKHCIVARIIHGGMIHRQGTLHVGDEIREINGVNVGSKSIENLQQMLRTATGDVTFKIVPSLRNEDTDQKDLYYRCLFDYDPRSDDLIPCQQAGVPFKCGDILEVASKADHMWWQARRLDERDEYNVAGLIPSTELQERRHTSAVLERRSNKDTNSVCIFPRKKKTKRRSNKYTVRLNTVFDSLELVTYEEVTFQKTFQRRTLILIGAQGVGRRHIKNSLISRFPERYSYPIPHTSRKPRPNEKHGEYLNFESEEHMLSAISNHQFLEYGQREGALYGTKLTTVRNLIKNGKMPVLDVETPALKILRCKEFAPYIVFISSPSSFPNSGDPKMDASLQRLVSDSENLKTRYRHLFDYTIVNHTIADTVEDLLKHLESLENSSDWIPVSWLY